MNMEFRVVPILEALVTINDENEKEWFVIDTIDYMEETFTIYDNNGDAHEFSIFDSNIRIKEGGY